MFQSHIRIAKASRVQLASLVIIKANHNWLLYKSHLRFSSEKSSQLPQSLQNVFIKKSFKRFSVLEYTRLPSQFSQLTSRVCQKTVVKICSSRHRKPVKNHQDSYLVFCRVKAYVGVVHLLQKPLVPVRISIVKHGILQSDDALTSRYSVVVTLTSL